MMLIGCGPKATVQVAAPARALQEKRWLEPPPLLIAVCAAALALGACSLLWLMFPIGGGHSTKQPNAWGPEMEDRYPFRYWCRDILLWTIANGDIDPHRQCAMVLMQLRGGAQELTRELRTNVIMNGGVINGQQVDGVSMSLASWVIAMLNSGRRPG
jgi:hypothetical protein